MNDLEVGDVVVLKSGGPKMTVVTLEEGVVETIWFEGTVQRAGKFPEVVLETFKEPQHYGSGSVSVKTVW